MTKPLSKEELFKWVSTWRWCCQTEIKDGCLGCTRGAGKCRLALRQIRKMIEEGR